MIESIIHSPPDVLGKTSNTKAADQGGILKYILPESVLAEGAASVGSHHLSTSSFPSPQTKDNHSINTLSGTGVPSLQAGAGVLLKLQRMTTEISSSGGNSNVKG